MSMIGMFPAHLSKFGATVKNEDVKVEFVITHISKNQSEQDFLCSYDDAFGTNLSDFVNGATWDNIKFTQANELDIKFDEMNLKAQLVGIKITQKETEDEVLFKYDLTFLKQQDKDVDTYLATYLKRKEENEDGKSKIVEYDVEIGA